MSINCYDMMSNNKCHKRGKNKMLSSLKNERFTEGWKKEKKMQK